jgi:D-alanyl-D-alanine carboxypeptidase (penicillin-binding protein 5/6)
MMKLLQHLFVSTLLVFCASAMAKPAHHAHSKSKPAATTQPAEQPAKTDATPTPAPATPHAVVGNEPVPPPPTLDAKSWLLMDYTTGQVLADSNADARVEPASITKVLTAYIVSSELAKGKIKLDDGVFISENAWRSGGASTEGSTSFLALNSKVPLKDLLYGMIIQSLK